MLYRVHSVHVMDAKIPVEHKGQTRYADAPGLIVELVPQDFDHADVTKKVRQGLEGTVTHREIYDTDADRNKALADFNVVGALFSIKIERVKK